MIIAVWIAGMFLMSIMYLIQLTGIFPNLYFFMGRYDVLANIWMVWGLGGFLAIITQGYWRKA